MPMLRQKIIKRADLKANPDAYYIFGDNEIRRGMAGQAGEMRGEPNAIGISTLKAPGVFWNEHDFVRQNYVLSRDFQDPIRKLQLGHVVIFPLDGIGTGLAELEKNSPTTWAYLQVIVARLLGAV